MNSLTEKTKLAIVIIGGLVLLGLAVLLVVRPLLDNIEQTRIEIKSTQEEIVRLAEEIQNYKTTIAEVEEVKKTTLGFSNIFPIREEMVILIEDLEQAAARSGVSFELSLEDDQAESATSRAPAQPTPPRVAGLKGIAEVGFDFIVTGNYQQLTGFFTYYENLPFFSELDEIMLSAESLQDQGGAQNLVNLGVATGTIQGALFIGRETTVPVRTNPVEPEQDSN